MSNRTKLPRSADSKNAPFFNIPTEKDVSWLENIHLLQPGRHRDIATDVKIGLSNEEISIKYNIPTIRQTVYVVRTIKAKVTRLYKKKKNKNYVGKKAWVKKLAPIQTKKFTHFGKTAEVHLVKVPSNRASTKKIIIDSDLEFYLYCKCKVLESYLPEKFKTRWKVLIRPLSYSHLIKESDALIKWLSTYRWVNEDGVPLDHEIELILTCLEEYRKDFEHLETNE